MTGLAAAPANRNAVTAGKGRPTPKRSEAERRRRQPSAPPATGKRRTAQYRERQRQDRARRQQGMQRGEQWALPPRDRGPVKALARDYVDSRRRLSEFYMYGLLVLLVLLFVRSPLVQSIVPVLVLVAVLIMLVEGIFIGRQVTRPGREAPARGEHPGGAAVRRHARAADPAAADAQAADQAR